MIKHNIHIALLSETHINNNHFNPGGKVFFKNYNVLLRNSPVLFNEVGKINFHSQDNINPGVMIVIHEELEFIELLDENFIGNDESIKSQIYNVFAIVTHQKIKYLIGSVYLHKIVDNIKKFNVFIGII